MVAVYGGSFNPPHVAHTLVAAYVLAAHAVDAVRIVPTARHPFEKELTDFSHRLRMCELAMAPLRDVIVDPIEHELGGTSVTLRTLQELRRRHPRERHRLVIGSDLLPETGAWHAWEQVSALAPPIVVGRAGHPAPDPGAPALPDVSSTEVRRRLHDGDPVDGLVSPRVADYVREHGLYT
jgi:nicotinate-nucleotide adenylyltransferase